MPTAYEARYEETLYSLLVEVKAHANFWQTLLDALKRQQNRSRRAAGVTSMLPSAPSSLPRRCTAT